MSDHLVDVSELSFWYRQGVFEHQVLQDVSLHLSAGEVVGLTGPSGSGKSTLLTIIGGLRSAEHGTVTALGIEVTGSSERQRVVLRRRIRIRRLPQSRKGRQQAERVVGAGHLRDEVDQPHRHVPRRRIELQPSRRRPMGGHHRQDADPGRAELTVNSG